MRISKIVMMSVLPVVAGCSAATARDSDSSVNPMEEAVASEEKVTMDAQPQAEGDVAKATFAAVCFWASSGVSGEPYITASTKSF